MTCIRCGADDWYVTPSSGHRRCRRCHARRAERHRLEQRLESLPEKIGRLKRELSELRQRYEASPSDWRLGAEVGRVEQQHRHWSQSEKVESEMQAARKAASEAQTRRQNYRPMEAREWEAAVPPTCPACGEPTRGFASRVGDRGWLHRACETEFQIQGDPNG